MTTAIWNEVEEKYKVSCNIHDTYDLTKKKELKKLALDSVNYLVKGYKIKLIAIRPDFISMISQYDVLFIGYTNRFGEYHEFNISEIVFPSLEYGSKYFDAFCIDEDGEPEGLERSFKIERIDFIKESKLKVNNEESVRIFG